MQPFILTDLHSALALTQPERVHYLDLVSYRSLTLDRAARYNSVNEYKSVYIVYRAEENARKRGQCFFSELSFSVSSPSPPPLSPFFFPSVSLFLPFSILIYVFYREMQATGTRFQKIIESSRAGRLPNSFAAC